VATGYTIANFYPSTSIDSGDIAVCEKSKMAAAAILNLMFV